MVSHYLACTFLAGCLVACGAASPSRLDSEEGASPELGWRCVSEIAHACEQWIFNDIERRAAAIFRDKFTPGISGLEQDLTLESVRIGEYLTSIYLVGAIYSAGSSPGGSHTIEISFEPGQPIGSTGVAKLGAERFVLGAADENARYLLATHDDQGRRVVHEIMRAFRSSFEEAVLEVMGGDLSGGSGGGSRCWRGCGDDSDERKFHEIGVLTKAFWHSREPLTVEQEVELECFDYSEGTVELPFPHWKQGNDMPFLYPKFKLRLTSKMILKSFEIFTDSVQAVLEGDVILKDDRGEFARFRDLTTSFSFSPGDLVGATGIPGLGQAWTYVHGLNERSPWLDKSVNYDFQTRQDVLVHAPRFESYQRICFYQDEIAEVDLYHKIIHDSDWVKSKIVNWTREAKMDFTPLIERLQSKVKETFASSVKIHALASGITPEELAVYRANYFDAKLEQLTARLKADRQALGSAELEFRRKQDEQSAFIDQARRTLDSETTEASEVLELRLKAEAALQATCPMDPGLLVIHYDVFLKSLDLMEVFEDETASIFRSAGEVEAKQHEDIFKRVAADLGDLEVFMSQIEVTLDYDLCASLTAILRGVVVKVEMEKSRNVISSYQAVSGDLQATIDRASKAAAKRLFAYRVIHETEAIHHRLDDARVSLSLSAVDAATRESEDLEGKLSRMIDGTVGVSEADKEAIKSNMSARLAGYRSDLSEFIEMLGGTKGFVSARAEDLTATKVGRLRDDLARKEAETKGLLLEAWTTGLMLIKPALPAACRTTESAFTLDACWVVPGPEGEGRLEHLAYDERLNDLERLIETLVSP